MRSGGKDIVELFGFAPDDNSKLAAGHFRSKSCPFVIGKDCSKTNHNQSVVYGTCSVTGVKRLEGYDEVIICPKRLYASNYQVFSDVIEVVWGDLPLVVGGTVAQLKIAAAAHSECVVAFGQNSGREVTIGSNGKLSMDWVLQRYTCKETVLEAIDFVGIEVQSIDTTGNYRSNHKAYTSIKSGKLPNGVPKAEHGLNWANVHKRLIPQIIRKGNVYAASPRCLGFFFILPESVYQKFDEILGDVPEEKNVSPSNLSVITYQLGNAVNAGQMRELSQCSLKHHSLDNIVKAFSKNSDSNAPVVLDELLHSLL